MLKKLFDNIQHSFKIEYRSNKKYNYFLQLDFLKCYKIQEDDIILQPLEAQCTIHYTMDQPCGIILNDKKLGAIF